MTQQHAKYAIGTIVQTAIYGIGRINQVCPMLQGGLGIRYQMVTAEGETRFVHESSIVKVVNPASVIRDDKYEKNLTSEMEALFRRHQEENGEVVVAPGLDLSDELDEIFNGPEEALPMFMRQAA